MAEQEVASENPLENFVTYVKRALDIVQLKADAIDKLSGDETAFTMGLVIIALAGVAASIGTFNPFGLVAFPVFFLVLAFVFGGVFHLLATQAFKGEGEFITFFRPYSHGHILFWSLLIPVLNLVILPWLASLWLLVVTALVVERVYQLDRAKAIATVAIPSIALFLLAFMFFSFVAWMLFLFGLRATG